MKIESHSVRVNLVKPTTCGKGMGSEINLFDHTNRFAYYLICSEILQITFFVPSTRAVKL
ncbi:CLUMA_CG021661, isoform A [Clunio marinus]|uniref:CLUMA_CG021661, isoform A n=1 Tax=Clunio marinus TaxID=568069 RepID=A0A1J1J8B6_9DIPT|nr:CLUMA_CG021661, isoform A [Clunio marinus]